MAHSEQDGVENNYGMSMEHLTPYTQEGKFHISNTWTLGPLSEMSYDEKMILKHATRREIKKFQE